MDFMPIFTTVSLNKWVKEITGSSDNSLLSVCMMVKKQKMVAHATFLRYSIPVKAGEAIMNDHFPNMGRCISILDRLMRMYYDHGLSDFEIGWGQQFYLEYIYDHPGVSAQEIVEYIRVDKATLTKNIKKLVEIGYVQPVENKKDKRVKHLYSTEEATPTVKRIKEIHRDFYNTLCLGLSEQDIHRTEQILGQMMENINHKVWHRMEE